LLGATLGYIPFALQAIKSGERSTELAEALSHAQMSVFRVPITWCFVS
jgi:hypothetical protein